MRGNPLNEAIIPKAGGNCQGPAGERPGDRPRTAVSMKGRGEGGGAETQRHHVILRAASKACPRRISGVVDAWTSSEILPAEPTAGSRQMTPRPRHSRSRSHFASQDVSLSGIGFWTRSARQNDRAESPVGAAIASFRLVWNRTLDSLRSSGGRGVMTALGQGTGKTGTTATDTRSGGSSFPHSLITSSRSSAHLSRRRFPMILFLDNEERGAESRETTIRQRERKREASMRRSPPYWAISAPCSSSSVLSIERWQCASSAQ